MNPKFPALVLAGGRSSRMGQDKADLKFAGRKLALYVADRLKAMGHEPVLINSPSFDAEGAPYGVVQDADGGFQGPLAGILAGLQFLQANASGATHLLCVPTDGPFFPESLAVKLAAAASEPEIIAMAMWQGRPEPAFSLWPVSLRDALRAWLDSDQSRSIIAFAEAHRLRLVEFSPAIGLENPFFNINSPDDFAEAERRLKAPAGPAILGIAGWKNSGKTGLTVRLVEELTRRGYRVSTIKHAHHDFDIDKVGADSYRHRHAGAQEVTIVSGTRFAVMHELRNEPEPSFEEILARIAPCDIVIIEGYKREPVPKIEARRLDARNRTPLAPDDPHIRAIAADHAVEDTLLPVFDLDDTQAIADFAEALCRLERKTGH